MIEELDSIYGRRQFSGYDRAFYHCKDGSRLTFVTYHSVGPKAEGEPVSALWQSREQAEDAFDKMMLGLLEQHPGHIHWRRTPETKEEIVWVDNWDGHDYQTRKLKSKTLYYRIARLVIDPHLPEDLIYD